MTPENRHTHPNYASGEDFILEFRSFSTGSTTSTSPARRDGGSGARAGRTGALLQDECADLVQLVAGGSIEFPVSPLGEYLLQRGDDVLTLHGENWSIGCASWFSAAPGLTCV